MGNNPKHALTPTLLFIMIIGISMTPNNADEELHISFPSLPSTAAHPPSHAPAPSPSHHRHHHHPGVAHHHHNHSSALAPSPSYASAPHQPSKPVTPSPPVAHAPTAKPPVAKSPVKAPTAKPPVAKSPVKSPSPVGKRKFVAVQGMVYCKNCSYSGVNNTLLGASPLAGARVVLRCRNTQYLLRKTATTDNNGYFFLEAPPQLTTYGAHKCKVYLAHLAKPIGPCSNATDLNNGATGAYLFSNNTGPPKEDIPAFSLFSVGPFAYESKDCPKK